MERHRRECFLYLPVRGADVQQHLDQQGRECRFEQERGQTVVRRSMAPGRRRKDQTLQEPGNGLDSGRGGLCKIEDESYLPFRTGPERIHAFQPEPVLRFLSSRFPEEVRYRAVESFGLRQQPVHLVVDRDRTGNFLSVLTQFQFFSVCHLLIKARI